MTWKGTFSTRAPATAAQEWMNKNISKSFVTRNIFPKGKEDQDEITDQTTEIYTTGKVPLETLWNMSTMLTR